MVPRNENSELVSVCWLLTSRCNYRCNFCFKVPNQKDILQKDAEKILLHLKYAGVKKISFSGGEPLLWSGNLPELIRRAKKLGIMTMIITNGSLLTPTVLNKLKGNLDWITLPLDGADEPSQNRAGRRQGHFSHTVSLLDTLQDFPFKIKINTVLSKQNLENIDQIAEIIRTYPIIRRWKIIQFFPIRDRSITNKRHFELSNAEFNKAQMRIIKRFKNKPTLVYFSSNEDLETAYFTLDPEGNIYISRGGKDVILGNAIRSNVARIWKRTTLVDKKRYQKRATWFTEL